MVGKAGTDAGAPKQQTGTEQRPGTSPSLALEIVIDGTDE
jgi:hypothetical protein